MSQLKGYERFLRNANPKLEMNRSEYESSKSDPESFVGSVNRDLIEDEARLIRLTRPGYRTLMAAGYIIVGLLMVFSSLVRKDEAILKIPAISVAGVLLILGFTTIGTINKKARYAPSNKDKLKVLVNSYLAFHLPQVKKSNNYDEYRQLLTMANVGDFQEIWQQASYGTGPEIA